MADNGVSFNEKCTCVQKQCKLWGNCVECVQNHVNHGDHVPECMQNILRETIGELAHKVEFKVEDGRHIPKSD